MFSWVELENPVAIWWLTISFFSTVNICAWFFIKNRYFEGISFSSIFQYWKKPESIIWLCFLYVFVCAFRSYMPRADVQRIVLFDTWFSSVFLGRSLATVAELAFVAQWSIVLGLASKVRDVKIAQIISKFIVPIIFVAEICSWYAVITTNYIGNTIEESLWGVTYVLIGVSLISLLKHFKGQMKNFCLLAILGCALYVTFMFTVDVPMYYERMQFDIAQSKPYLSFGEGIIDLNTRWNLTHDIEEWRTEIPWMTLYFTLATLSSLLLCLLPLKLDNWKKHFKF